MAKTITLKAVVRDDDAEDVVASLAEFSEMKGVYVLELRGDNSSVTEVINAGLDEEDSDEKGT